MSAELRQALERVARRFRLVRLWSGLALCWFAWAALGAGISLALSLRSSSATLGLPLLATFAGLALVSGAICATLAWRSARDPRWVARMIERKHPDLETGLLAAVEEDAASQGKLGFLQTAVIRSAVEHSRSNSWIEVVPSRRISGAKLAHGLALGVLGLATIALAVPSRRGDPNFSTNDSGSIAFDVSIEPGNVSIERGTPLLVVARFRGAVPLDASLVVDGGMKTEGRHTMTRGLEDPTFAGRVESVASDLAYRVEFQGRTSPTFQVRVFEYPELQRADAKLVFPVYTALPAKTVEDVRHVTAVEGTELTLLCRLNKDVKVAQLIDQAGHLIKLTPDASGPHAYRATLTLADSQRFRLGLVDRDGRTNRLLTEIAVNVTRNKPPVVTMSQPARDVRVSPVEELALKAQLEDDFGVVRHGLSYTIAGHEPREIALHGPEKASKRVKSEHIIDFESLAAKPDQLVTYFVWAEDVGPDGKPRRSSGDMFFAEVRHFEEIFRQGEQPPEGSESQGEQGENAQAAYQLAELQKEIINATWTLIRRETGAKPSARFVDDAKLIGDSQKNAIGQAEQLAERLENPASKTHLEQATGFMNGALKRLAEAAETPSIAALSPALVAEQAAYQALLKLRDREFNVVRGNRRQRQGGASSGGPSQRQLQQLELSNEENRYEEQRSARARQENLTQREREQAESRQVMNRLKELARRQTDLNNRLKELQSALEAAKTPQAREEIERQLKRLRDQQQQILRDTDELRERMELEENRERMADARQQVDESREHVRQASDALEDGRVAQALTEGTRAGRQLNDVREELRKKASNRFSEEMTEMRGESRKLEENQTKLSQQLDEWGRNPQRGLRDSGARQQARAGLEEQEKKLDELLGRMRKTVEDAEETEPLLAKELFDTVRKANEKAIPDALQGAEQLVDAGVPEEAARSSRQAGEGMTQLREGVERAARSVLGDETEALRRAQGELDELADAINREIAQATGRDVNAQTRDRDRASDGANRNGQNGASRPSADGQARSEQGQQGEPEQGDPQAGQRQGGQQAGEPGQQKSQSGQRGAPGKGQQNGRGQGQRQRQDQQQDAGPGEQPGDGDQQGQASGQGQRRQGPLRGGNANANPAGAGGQPGGEQDRQGGAQRDGGGTRRRGIDGLLDGVPNGPGGPITGEGFRQWSDRLRDVEELLDDPNLRAEAARIRDRARGAREEFKRHAKVPDWTKLQQLVADPIRELRDRVAEEVRRRASPDALVPIDRDPVPPQFSEGVRRYYERLGSGR
jgi:hypothetical protein